MEETLRIAQQEPDARFDGTGLLLKIARRWAELGHARAVLLVRGLAERLPQQPLGKLAAELAQHGADGEYSEVLEKISDAALKASLQARVSSNADGLMAAWKTAAAIPVPDDRTRTQGELAARLAAMLPREAYLFWRKWIRTFASRSRHRLLAELTVLAPLIGSLADREAICIFCRRSRRCRQMVAVKDSPSRSQWRRNVTYQGNAALATQH